jgi:hypothetical protein
MSAERRNAVRAAGALLVVALIGGQGIRFAQHRAHRAAHSDGSGPITSRTDLWATEPPIWPWLSPDEIRNWKPGKFQLDRYDSIATPEQTAARFVRSALLLSSDVDTTVVARSRSEALVSVGRAGASQRVRLRLARAGERGPWLLTSVERGHVPTNPPQGSVVRVGTQVSGPAPVGARKVWVAVSSRGEGRGFETEVADGRWTVAVPQLHAGFQQSQAPDGGWVTVANSPAGPLAVSVTPLGGNDFDFSFTTFALAD